MKDQQKLVLQHLVEKLTEKEATAEKFNTYKFADYKDPVIELIKKVTTVRVETMKIIKEMEKVRD